MDVESRNEARDSSISINVKDWAGRPMRDLYDIAQNRPQWRALIAFAPHLVPPPPNAPLLTTSTVGWLVLCTAGARCIKGRSLWTVGLGVILGVCLIPVLTSVTGNTDDVNTHAQGQDTVDQGIRLAVICSKSDLPEDQRSNRDMVFEIRYCLGSSGFCQSEDNVIATLSRFYNATILENTPYQRGWMEKETFPDNITLHLIAKQESVSHCLKCHRTVDVTFKPQDLAVSTLCFKDLATLSGCLSSGPFSICGPSISGGGGYL
ncbi:hypothetical protein C0Q70_04511 [Pomacea canaliculata]|uniref:Uncharacterized protein n=1 Tax=Pomacea canaliculata TaxID=400727 RepID=A0A2T7PIL3_POMCA|nr:hypothetical protein C0Q70_04511 [Pomacea canaliculata]